MMHVLAVDVGGTHVKVLVTGESVERKVDSGPSMTAAVMVGAVKKLTVDWTYDAVSIGYPGPVVHDVIVKEPANLGRGWVGFDFAAAFGRPVKLINDAAMQALGSDQGGRMLFLGLGTGLGSAMVVDGRVEPLELAHLPYKDKLSYEDLLGWFFRMHDPTTPNRQGNDVGTQYRSAIFYENDEQKRTAEKVKARVDASGKWKRPITTEIVAATEFWPAEDYHQNYLQKHPGGYTCHYLRD